MLRRQNKKNSASKVTCYMILRQFCACSRHPSLLVGISMHFCRLTQKKLSNEPPAATKEEIAAENVSRYLQRYKVSWIVFCKTMKGTVLRDVSG
jgi:hypothetical protein